MKILLVEDNQELGALIRDFIKKDGYDVVWTITAEDGMNQLEMDNFGLVLLDVMLPGMDGFRTCSMIRQKSNIPILMMSAKNDDCSKLEGYENGADDYIDKPFAIPVLMAKIKALSKRSQSLEQKIAEGHQIITLFGITLDVQARTVKKNGELVSVNGKEFDVLYELMKHPGEVITKERLFNRVWGIDCYSELTTLNVHIRWLREKLEEEPKNPKIIQTVWRVGYRFGN